MGAWPQFELIDDRQGNQFKVVMLRPVEERGPESDSGRDQVGTKSKLAPEQHQMIGRMSGEQAMTDLLALKQNGSNEFQTRRSTDGAGWG